LLALLEAHPILHVSRVRVNVKGRKTVYRKKKRKCSFEMDGRCGSRPESNEDGDDEMQREMDTDC